MYCKIFVFRINAFFNPSIVFIYYVYHIYKINNSIKFIPLHDFSIGCGRSTRARGSPPWSEERPGSQNFPRQPVPGEYPEDQLRYPVPGPLGQPDQAGSRGRTLNLSGAIALYVDG